MLSRDDIIRMARENGFYRDGENTQKPLWVWTDDELVQFAALVAAAEREACARVCDEMESRAEELGTECCKWPTPSDCAAAIRARGQQQEPDDGPLAF